MTYVSGLPHVLVITGNVVHLYSNCVNCSFVFLQSQLYSESYLTGPLRSGVHNSNPVRSPENSYESLGV